MHEQFPISHLDLADMPIRKRLQNGTDIMVSFEFAALEQDVSDVQTNRVQTMVMILYH
jgi:hypothetical protein